MDIEFHYYMTYLIAARAGYPPEEATTIAHACQMVDDNTVRRHIGNYRNYISQTSNILKPAHKLFRIYFQFHFIPGDPERADPRGDGVSSLLVTTPGSGNARAIMERTLAENDPYLTGIACHAFADTWAHQNFIGYYSCINAMKGVLESLSPDIGHADAGHQPDQPDLTWKDVRLMKPNDKIRNSERFLDAAEALFRLLHAGRHPEGAEVESEASALRNDLGLIIGPHSKYKNPDSRIEAYCALAGQPPYGGRPLPGYHKNAWFDAAVDYWWPGIFLKWKDPRTFQHTDWYRFQQKIQFYQNEISWPILRDRVFRKMHLASL